MTRISKPALFLMACLAITPVIALYAPRFLAFWPAILGVTLYGVLSVLHRAPLAVSPLYLKICAGLLTISALSLTWSVAPEHSSIRVIKLFPILIGGGLLLSVMHALRTECARVIAPVMCIAISCGALLCSLDLSFDFPVLRMVKGVDEGVSVNPSNLNRGTVVFILLAFPTLWGLQHSTISKPLRYVLGGVLVASLVLLCSITESQSAQLSFAVGMILFGLFSAVQSRFMTRGMAVALILGIILAPCISAMLYDAFLLDGQEIPWLKNGYAGNRVEIWYTLSQYALQSPILGYGIEATRYIPDFNFLHVYHKGDSVLHPHNFALQIWLEFGAIGAGLACIAVALVFKAMEAKTAHTRGMILTSLLTTVTIASIGYGMWQSWWIGTLILVAGVVALNTSQGSQHNA